MENVKPLFANFPRGEFKSRPIYFADGDFIKFFSSNETHFAERIDELLTVYRSMNSKEIVGCKIKGVKTILETCNVFGLSIDAGTWAFGIILLAAKGKMREDAREETYSQLGKKFGSTAFDPRDIQTMAA